MKRLLVLQHLEIEGPGLFEQFAKEKDLKIKIIRLDKKDTLPKTKKGDLILIMGGPMELKILAVKDIHCLRQKEN